MTTVQEIHNEFYSADERLLMEAMNLISNPRAQEVNKAQRYTKLGFGSCKPVKEAEELSAKALVAKELKETIWYFRQHYPQNKFITELEVERICKKYGLLLGESANYIGDIPEKNLLEIERFKLRKEDLSDPVPTYFGFSSLLWRSEPIGMISSRPRQVGGASFLDEYLQEKANQYYGIGADPYKSEKKDSEKVKPAFKICAPKQDFNTAGYEVREGFKLVYDPVVLQPVKGGFLIVSAWGDEASDEIVVNQKMN